VNLHKLLLTKNNCYIAGAKLNPIGVCVHSTGSANTALKRYIGPDDGFLGKNTAGNDWNQPKPDGTEKCAHAFIGKLQDATIATYQTLPWDMRGWHCGGKGNDTHIGFEICEDGLTDPNYFAKVYKEAVELAAYFCGMYGIKPEKPSLICHSEGYALGLASNHADVMHWFPKFGKDMDMFRDDVKAEMTMSVLTPEPVAGAVENAMKVSVNGVQGGIVPSILYKDLNYPNLRELCKMLGVGVDWDAGTGTVKLTK